MKTIHTFQPTLEDLTKHLETPEARASLAQALLRGEPDIILVGEIREVQKPAADEHPESPTPGEQA